jgi:hypothetical protein
VKLRKTAWLALAVLATSAFYILWSSHLGQPPVTKTPISKSKVQQFAASNTAQNAQEIIPPLSAGVYQGLNDPRWKWWNYMKKADPSFEWKMPINFFGKVVDENNNLVEGAAVSFTWNDLSATGTSQSKTKSGADGRFQLVDEKGKGLTVYVSKAGYHTSGGVGGKSFEYAAFFEGNYHRPDAANPMLFRLVHKIESESLIVRHVSQYLPGAYDGEEYYYDPVRGNLTRVASAEGALKFHFERSQTTQGSNFTWQWMIEAVNCALQERTDEFAQLAPEDSYVMRWQQSENKPSVLTAHSVTSSFYLQTADNHYALVDIALSHPNSRTAGPNLTITSRFNPKTGSRNLEYDPAKSIKAH